MAASSKYALLLDGNQRCFALTPLPAAGELLFESLPERTGSWADSVRSMFARVGLRPAALGVILVRQGKGSFSDTRSVALLANLLSHFAAVPVRNLGEDEPWFLKDGSPVDGTLGEIKPAYYAEPNITQAK